MASNYKHLFCKHFHWLVLKDWQSCDTMQHIYTMHILVSCTVVMMYLIQCTQTMKYLPLQMGPPNSEEHRHWNESVPCGTAHVPPFWQGFSGHVPYFSVLEWDLTDNNTMLFMCCRNAVLFLINYVVDCSYDMRSRYSFK